MDGQRRVPGPPKGGHYDGPYHEAREEREDREGNPIEIEILAVFAVFAGVALPTAPPS